MFSHVVRALKTIISTPAFLFSHSAEKYYEYLGDDVVEGHHSRFVDPNKPLWLNLGYWKTARRYPEAAEALTSLLGTAAALGPNDEQLDMTAMVEGGTTVYKVRAYVFNRLNREPSKFVEAVAATPTAAQ